MFLEEKVRWEQACLPLYMKLLETSNLADVDNNQFTGFFNLFIPNNYKLALEF